LYVSDYSHDFLSHPVVGAIPNTRKAPMGVGIKRGVEASGRICLELWRVYSMAAKAAQEIVTTCFNKTQERDELATKGGENGSDVGIGFLSAKSAVGGRSID
jgi:hypothetical protein